MRIFFATDIHGSEVCWRKFLNSAAFYKADLVVLGGDVTGKAMVPIVAHQGYWQVTLRGETLRLDTKDELDGDLDLQKRLYEGFFNSWYGNPQLGGFMIWNWTPDGGGPDDKTYTPRGKPAYDVMKHWFAQPRWKVQ